MLLYDFPLVRSSLSIKSLGGLFTRSKSHQSSQIRSQPWLPKTYYELIVAKTSSFQLYRYKKSLKSQKVDMQFINSTDVYGEICQIQTCSVRISESREYIDILIVTLNNGQLLVYNYAKDQKRFTCAYRDLIFKSKTNTKMNIQNPRHVGNYITCSEQNHFLISSIRCHRKLFHIHATLYEEKLKINVRPHQFHAKQNTICWNMIWLPSMGNETEYLGKYVAIQKNMIALQSQHHDRGMVDERQQSRNSPEKKLKYYYVERGFKLSERDQRKQGFRRLQQSAHMLIPISSSSFFILYENSLYLRQLPNQQAKQTPRQQTIDIEFPLREALVDKNIKCMFSCYSRQFLQDRKNVIYIVNEFGDLFKLEYYMTGSLVANIAIKYIYSVKTCHSIVYVNDVDKNQVQLGEHSQPIKVKHETATLILLGLERFSISLYFLLPTQSVETKPKQTKVAIRPIGKPKTTRTYPQYSDKQSFKLISQRSRDLQLSDQIQHKGVIFDTKIANLRSNLDDKNQQNFQIFALTNSGNLRHQEHIDVSIDNNQIHKSRLKIIKKGLKTKEINSLQSPKLHQIYCLKRQQKDPYHKIAILCMTNKTHIYTISNDAFTSNKQFSFQQTATSIYIGTFQLKQIGKFQDDSFVQIYGNKIRHIRKEKSGIREFQIKNRIVTGVCIGRQLFIALYGGQIFYYELDREKQILQLRKQFYVNAEVVAMEPTSLQNNKLQLGGQKRGARFLMVATKNYQLLIYKLGFKSDKQTTVDSIYEEIIKSPIQSLTSVIVAPDDLNGVTEKTYFVLLGMQNGSMIKMEFDRSMKKVNQKVTAIGSKPVKVKRSSTGSKREDSVLIISDKTFIHYIHNGKYRTHLIACSNIDLAMELKLPENPNCLMTFGERFPSNKDVLRILSIQSFGQDFHDQKVDLFFSGKKLLVFQNNIGIIEADPSYEKMQKKKKQKDIDIESSIIEIENLQKTWKSQFTIYKVKDAKKIAAIYFDQTKQICLCAAYNSIKNGTNPGNYLIFGCAEGMTYYPKFEAKQQTIKVYSWIVEKKANQKQNQYKTQFLYSLNIDSIPLVIQPFFKGQKFLIGVGRSLRLYEVGKKKLLLKAQTKMLSSNINQIKTYGKKIFVTSATDSYHLLKYIPQQKTFYDIAEDQLPKYITAMNIVDGQTVCAGDKFGNLFIGRLSQNAKSEFESMNGASSLIDSGNLHKFNTLAKINLCDIVTSINKVNLYTSKVDVILYSTVMGQLRVLYPLTEYEQVKVLPLLEEKIQAKYNIKAGEGNNWGSRSQIVMGEIVQRFLSMSENEQRQILRQTRIIDQNYVEYLKDLIEGIRSKII